MRIGRATVRVLLGAVAIVGIASQARAALDIDAEIVLLRNDCGTLSNCETDFPARVRRGKRVEALSLLNANHWKLSATACELGIGRGVLRARMRWLGLHDSARLSR